jgi:hypothetical protein
LRVDVQPFKRAPATALFGGLGNAIRGAPWWQQVAIIATVAFAYTYACGFFLGARALPRLRGWGEGVPMARLREAAPSDIQALFVRWDSNYYLRIAQDGYMPQGNERAFFPLYPLLVSQLNSSFHVPVLWAGALLSAMAFAVAGLFMYRLIRIDFQHRIALMGTALMYASPMAFFFLAFYGEVLLLLGAIAGVYFARKGNFVAAGCAIALAGAARPTAFLLGVPYIIEFCQQRIFSLGRWFQFCLGALIAPIGTLAYLMFLSQQSGGGDLFSVYASAVGGEWKTQFTWPWETARDGLAAALFGVSITADWFSRTLVWHDLFYAVLGLALCIFAWRRMRMSAVAFLFAGMFLVYAGHGPYGYAFWSAPREVAVLFPIYVSLALYLSGVHVVSRYVVLGLSTLLLGAFSAWFASGRWIA